MPRAAAAFRRRIAAVVVCGCEWAGRSMTVVTPPAAAAWVPLAKPWLGLGLGLGLGFS